MPRKLAARILPPPPRRLLTPCAKEARGPPPHWGMGIGLRGLASASNAQEVKFVVLGAELGRRLKKKVRKTDQSLPKARFSLHTLGARCPRPDPAGRSAELLCLPPRRGWTGTRRGRPEGAGGSPPAAEVRGLGFLSKLVERKIRDGGTRFGGHIGE